MAKNNTASPHTGTQLALKLALPEAEARDPRSPPVRLRASTRARHLQVKVSPWQGVEIIVPRRRSPRDVEHFLAEHRDWIDRAWRRLLKEYPQAGSLQLPERIALPLLDRDWSIRYTTGGRLREGTDDVLLVPHDGDLAATATRLQEWLKKKARDSLPQRMERWCERTGLYPDKVVIRGQATRWGSCSTRRTISLNFRLMFLDSERIDCLLLHEICHLKHLNHGTRFWALMEKHMPGARARDRSLGEGWKDVPPWALVK